MDALFAALAPRRVERGGLLPGLGSPNSRSQKSREKWTAGGVDYDVETTTYGNPNGIFYATKRTAKPREPTFHDAQSSRPFMSGGLMGAAFDLLGDMAAAHNEQASRRESHARQRSANFGRQDEELFSTRQPDHRRSRTHQTDNNSRRSMSPGEIFEREFRRQRTQDDWGRYDQPSRGFADDAQTNRRSKDSRSHARGASGADDDDISSKIDALKRTLRFEKEAIERCRRRAAEFSSRSTPPRDEEMQILLDSWRKHQMLLDKAMEELRIAREIRDRQRSDPRHNRSTRQEDKHAHHSRSRPSKQQRQTSSKDQGQGCSPFGDGDGFHDPFASFFGNTGGMHGFDHSFFHAHSHACPHNPPCQAHSGHAHFGHAQFGGLPDEFIDMLFGAFPSSGRSGKRGTKTKTSPRAGLSQHIPTPQASSTPRQQPPSSWLRPDEAKSLYKTYTEKWAALTPTDPKVPFPGRDLIARSLTKRDSIYAPNVFARVSTWSEENVMQANVQAFFLGAVGLAPVYSETGPAKLVMSYDKAKASDQQVRDLMDILKKEKVRWHSDRLGRRNGGSANGPNTTLQQDERARAVFHAVCELMEVAQA
jgi:hypothetical protein